MRRIKLFHMALERLTHTPVELDVADAVFAATLDALREAGQVDGERCPCCATRLYRVDER